MSADRYSQCPQCAADREAVAEAKRLQAKAAYGIVPVQEYEALRTESDLLIQQIPGTPETCSYREDWDIYGAESGEVHIRYVGSCSVCGLTVRHSEDIPIQLKESGA